MIIVEFFNLGPSFYFIRILKSQLMLLKDHLVFQIVSILLE